jgi:hypothetical protein
VGRVEYFAAHQGAAVHSLETTALKRLKLHALGKRRYHLNASFFIHNYLGSPFRWGGAGGRLIFEFLLDI